MEVLFEIAAKVVTPISLLAYAIAALIYLYNLSKRRKVTAVLWVTILLISFLASLPFVARFWIANWGVYHLRALILGSQGTPTEDAIVTCSLGGEAKKIAGGWQFDIPVANKPIGGRGVLYAAVPSAFLSGKVEFALSEDLNPVVELQLERETSARVWGSVVTTDGSAVEGATVSIVGYGTGAVVTEKDGAFQLAGHVAEGQQVQLRVEKKGFKPATQWHAAGKLPVTVVLEKK